jgi:electron transfer flavoprotein alpha/beta subunit
VRILVLQQPAPDLRVPPERDPRTGRVLPVWDVTQLDPADSAALDLALQVKDRRAGTASHAVGTDRLDTEVVLLHLGPVEAEPWLRDGLARGADRAVRVWDGVVAGAGAPGMAVVVAAAAAALACDLVVTGVAGSVYGSGQLGVLLARRLGYACVTQVAALAEPALGAFEAPVPSLGEIGTGPPRAADRLPSLLLARGLAAGLVELVEADLPAVLTVLPGTTREFAAPLPAVLAAQAGQITVWDLATLGVPATDVRAADHALRYGRLRTPRPRLRPLAAPDPALSAFDRIHALIEGAVRRREGRVVRGGEVGVAQEVFATLRDEGWLDHLRTPAIADSATPSAPPEPHTTP